MFLTSQQKNNCLEKGFTLIELMVASTLFIIVMVVSVGSIISIVDANRKAQALNSVINNLNFAIESMVRDIRTGTGYSIENNGTSISFTNQSGKQITYSYVAAADSEKSKVSGGGEEAAAGIGGDAATTALQLGGTIQKNVDGTGATDFTAPEVNITKLLFQGTGLSASDGQPRVLVLIEGYAGTKVKTKSDFSIQTLVSQRFLDSNG